MNEIKEKIENTDFYDKMKSFMCKIKTRDFDFELTNKTLAFMGVIMLGILVADQVTKLMADRIMMEGQNYEIIDGFFYFTYVHNKGMAWSLLEGRRWLFLLTTPLVLCGLIYFFTVTKKHEILTRFGIVLVVGGALGNFIDRAIFGYVRDFIHFYIFNYDFPVFNIADIAVCLGIGLIILEIIIQEYQIWKLSKSL
jgi:lipoprotein signal peptidase